MTPRRVRWLPTAQRAAAATRMHTVVPGPHVCRDGRCHLAGGAVVLCARHAAALVSGGAR